MGHTKPFQSNAGDRLRQIKEKAFANLNRPGTKRGLMILKIFLGMEWMLILGGDLGLYVYLFFLVLFGPKNSKASRSYASLASLSSLLRCAVAFARLKRFLICPQDNGVESVDDHYRRTAFAGPASLAASEVDFVRK